MKAINFRKSAMAVTLTFSFAIPQIPFASYAKDGDKDKAKASKSKDDDDDLPTDLFPVDSLTGKPLASTSGTSTKSSGGSDASMNPAQVPEAYACPTFDQGPNKDLMVAINALNKEIGNSNECKNDASASSVQSSTQDIQKSIETLKKMMAASAATGTAAVDIPQIEQSVTTAINGIQSIGNTLNNNAFLNSNCGRQTMSTGKVLLAFNDLVNSMSPYALFAVSMNAALVPALPYVVAGVAVSAGISVLAKTIQSHTVDMDNPNLRKAVLQNACQYVKVAKKVRFMQLAQSGQMTKITDELQKNVTKYTATFSQPSRELYSLLKYKDTSSKTMAPVIAQYGEDRKALINLDQEFAQNTDDLMTCTLSRELVNWAQDQKSFPASVINNLETTAKAVRTSSKLQVNAMRSLHETAMKRVVEYANRSATDDAAIKSCAQAGRSWVAGIHQSLNLTSNLVNAERKSVEDELAQNAEYRTWKVQYDQILIEKMTVQRVQTAMEALARNESIIDRSELSQRIVNLRAGLFGAPGRWIGARPPVLEWMVHTKDMHDRSISSFVKSWNALYDGSWSLTRMGQNQDLHDKNGRRLSPSEANQVLIDDIKGVKDLNNLNLTTLPTGSAGNKLACGQLESAWLDWSSALDHLGAIQYFCNMIDDVLDNKMDTSILQYCRGNQQLNGQVYALSIVDSARATLKNKGYGAQASIISQKLKDLQCPMPDVSVMQ